MPRQAARHTLYDVLDQKGYFDSNPANASALGSDGSSIYEKQEFPRMVYHPEGRRRVTVPAEVVLTPFGPKEYGEQREIIYREVRNAKELREAQAEGWHLLPAMAMAAAGEAAPALTAGEQRVQSAEAEMAAMRAKMAEMQAQLDEAKAAPPPPAKQRTSSGQLLA